MKKYLAIVLCFSFLFSFAQDVKKHTIKEVLITDAVEVQKPVFADIPSVKDEKYNEKQLLSFKYLSSLKVRPEEGDKMEWTELELLKWKKKTANSNNEIKLDKPKKEYELRYLAFYVENNEWADLKLEITTGNMLEVYVDGNKKDGKYSFETKGEESQLKSNIHLVANNHIVIFKILSKKQEKASELLQINFEIKNKENSINLVSGLNSHLYMDINHLMNGVDIKSASISPIGDYYWVKFQMQLSKKEKESITEIRKVDNNQIVQTFYGNEVRSLKWVPNSNSLSYINKVGTKYWIWQWNPENGQKMVLASELEDINAYKWSSNKEFLIFSKYEQAEKNKTGLKQVQGMPDHWPWYRNRGNLFIYDILSGVEKPLTHGYYGNNLVDISPNGRYILFSQHIYDESLRPYSKQILMRFDRRSSEIDTLWNKFGSGRVSFSPDGKQLLVLAGPVFFGDIGKNVKESQIPNDYDSQAFIYNLDTKEVEAISKEFNPKIESAYWSQYNKDQIFFKVSDRTYNYVYRYDVNTNTYNRLELEMDVVNSTSYADSQPLLLYYGSSISTPKKLYMAKLDDSSTHLLDYPEENFFADVKFGKTEDWNFINAEDVTIEGRIYYPPQFDENKEYPMIVYYYAGTSPTERNFRGRYPKNLFAANGYIVYVLQPSGATGYGQEFSAKHVNNWGKTVADEIIQGAKGICETHSFIDKDRVGIIGASYGGFMTMYLTTQTDFFSAAISHAGISSISSYWGEGYWGYLYSQVASAESFPWNNKDLYVEQSPLFHADKVTTPILLLHGNSDTNVPPGESRQFYTALKLLQKEVELIEIDKQDHHIKDYNKRILWQKTILAWFDKHLKKQVDWWNHLYPKKNL